MHWEGGKGIKRSLPYSPSPKAPKTLQIYLVYLHEHLNVQRIRASVLKSGNSWRFKGFVTVPKLTFDHHPTPAAWDSWASSIHGSNMFCWLSHWLQGLSTPTRRTTHDLEFCLPKSGTEFTEENSRWMQYGTLSLWTALPLVLCSQSASFHFPASLDWLALCVEAHYSPSSFFIFSPGV